MTEQSPAAPPPPRQFTVRLTDGRTFGPADLAMLVHWVREGRVPQESLIESEGSPPMRAVDHPNLAPLFAAPPTIAGPVMTPPETDSGINLIIPYRNGFALASYYTGVFALIPIFGLILGPLAITFGILGLRHAASRPSARGRVHAWVGILLGLLVLAGHVAAFFIIRRL